MLALLDKKTKRDRGQGIAQRDLVQEGFKRTETLLVEAQQIAHIGSWTWNLQSDALEWSEEHYRIFGFEVRDPRMTRDLAWTRIHPEDLGGLKQAVAQAHESRTPFDVCFRVLRKDGSIRVAQSRGQVAAEENGQPVRMCGTIQDITDRAEAEEKLRRSESLLAEAQKVAHIGSWSWDIPSGTLIWSDEHYRLFGLEPQEMPMTFDRFLNLVHPDDRAIVQNAVDLAMREHRPFECTMRALHRDGTVRDVHARGRIVLADGKTIERLFGTVQDVTAAKRAEEALRGSEERVRLLLESTAEAVYGLDIEGNCTFSNPACLRLLGYTDPGDLLGKSMHALIHHTRRDGTAYPKEACGILRAFLRGEEVHTDDEVLWRADGTSFPAEYWSHPVRREGEIVGAVVTFLDITERKRLEKEILEISERERRRIGQDLHDDLCQQLTGIAFTGQLLQQRLAARSIPEAGVAEKIVVAVQQATASSSPPCHGVAPGKARSRWAGGGADRADHRPGIGLPGFVPLSMRRRSPGCAGFRPRHRDSALSHCPGIGHERRQTRQSEGHLHQHYAAQRANEAGHRGRRRGDRLGTSQGNGPAGYVPAGARDRGFFNHLAAQTRRDARDLLLKGSSISTPQGEAFRPAPRCAKRAADSSRASPEITSRR